MAWRRCRASRGAWLGGEEEGVAAKLLSSAEGRGVAGGGCYGERRRWWRSDTGEGERGRGGEEPRESEREQGEGVASFQAIQTRRGGAGRQASWWRGAVARARAGHTPLPLSRTKTTEEEAGWAACWLGRPAAAGLHRGEPQVSFSSLFLFFIFF